MARDFTASIASVYRLSARKVALSDVNTDLPGLDRLLKLKKRLRKLWQKTRDLTCKTAVNWVTKSIRRLTRGKALQRWETKIANTEVTPHATRIYGQLRNPSRSGIDQRHQLQFVVLSALFFIR
jgi:hypothetical protein